MIRFFVLEYGRIKSRDLRLRIDVFNEFIFLCFMAMGNPVKIPATTGSVYGSYPTLFEKMASFGIFELKNMLFKIMNRNDLFSVNYQHYKNSFSVDIDNRTEDLTKCQGFLQQNFKSFQSIIFQIKNFNA